MSKVERIEAELAKLSPTELHHVREFLEVLREDELPFNPEFQKQIQESELEMAAGLRPRARHPLKIYREI